MEKIITRKMFVLLFTLFISMFINSRVYCTPLSETYLELYCSNLSNLTASSIDINIGGTIHSTGLMTITLDPDYYGESNYFRMDFSDGSIREEYHVLVDFPLLSLLGESAQKLHITEIGGPGTFTYTDVELTDDWTSVEWNVIGSLSGLGIFEPGQFMSDWIFENCFWPFIGPEQFKKPVDDLKKKIRQRNKQIEELMSLTDPTLSDPTGNVNVLNVSYGTGTFVTVIPEPATFFLFGVGLLSLVGISRRKK